MIKKTLLRLLSIAFLLAPITLVAQTDVKSTARPQLPFVFLNQYFEFNVTNYDNIILSDKVINWTASIVEINDGKLIIPQNNFFGSSLWDITLKDANGKNISSFLKQSLATEKVLPIAKEAAKEVSTATQVCFLAKSKFSQVYLCKNISIASASKDYPQVYISKKRTNNLGRVILNDPKKSILLEVRLSANEFIKMTTRKHNVVPSEVEKDIEKREYVISFIDMEVADSSWTERVGYEQDSFRVPSDDLILVNQDYFNKDFSNKELSITYYVPPYKKPKAINYWSVIPFLGFSKLEGNTLAQNVIILSEMDLGVKYQYQREIKDDVKYISFFDYWNASAYIKSVKYVPSVNNYTIGNASSLLYAIEGSLNKKLNEKMSYGFRFNVQKDVSLDQTSASNLQVNMNNFLNMDVGALMTFNVYDRGRFSAVVTPGVGLILPTKMSGDSAKMGTRIFTKFDVNYSDKNKFYGLGFNYDSRSQENSVQKMSNQTFDYTASYAVLF